MRILHLDGFNKEDSLEYRSIIHSNCMHAMTQMLEACSAFAILHEMWVQWLSAAAWTVSGPAILCKPVIIVVSAFNYLIAQSSDFLDNIVRLTEDNYVPTTQDIIQSRFRTTGISEISFTHRKMDFKMVDVGGQRSERRKWIHCFDNVDMVLFVVSMADYDQLDPEDSRFVSDNSPEDAKNYVQKQFKRCIQERHKFFNFVTTATDTKNIDLVFCSAVAHIVNENLRSTGLQE
ncbi:unnamed protein product [Caenorhabditis auriculariae]|uniref:G-protein alpha subunit n=1 Tax=Caenorhabditis auriculariae TaxID=2777116 RepID=A0A8S1HVL3_9PELO|nr:unnamed protein product [Caenorhabditis auriculariae]